MIKSSTPGFFRVGVVVVIGVVVGVVIDVVGSTLTLNASTLIFNVRVRKVAAEKVLILSWLPYTGDQQLL